MVKHSLFLGHTKQYFALIQVQESTAETTTGRGNRLFLWIFDVLLNKHPMDADLLRFIFFC